MKNNQFIGLIKFFRNNSHLEMFLDGLLYCNTPEFYRLSEAPGVSDKNDSCLISYRESRGDSGFKIFINDRHIKDVINFTARNGRKDGWLHCWAALYMPSDDTGFEKLKSDITRLQSEFWPHFACVPPNKVNAFIDHIQLESDLAVEVDEVKYTEKNVCHSVFRKADKFSYQREARFVFGECSDHCTASKSIYINGGFRDFAEISPKIEISATTENNERLELIIDHE